MRNLAYTFLAMTVFFGMSFNTYAQMQEDMPRLKEIKASKLAEKIVPQKHKSGLWGYADSEGKFVVKPVFNAAYEYEGNVARINWNMKWGTINNRGLYVVEPIYDRFDPYSADSLAVVAFSGIYCLIDARGRMAHPNTFDAIEYADYGYKVRKDGKYGTINKKGEVCLDLQFDDMFEMDKSLGLEFIRKGDKWGILKDGKEILALDYDTTPYDANPDDTRYYKLQKRELYIVMKDGKQGVITPYGQFVAPCVYDEIVMSISGDYFVTRVGNKYGALSFKMRDMLHPVEDKKPVIGERLIKLFYDGVYYAGNKDGVYPFDEYMSIYEMFHDSGMEDEIVTAAKSLPDWAKADVISSNVSEHEEKISAAQTVVDLLVRYSYDAYGAGQDDSMPKGIETMIPGAVAGEKYGIMDCGTFFVASGIVPDNESGYHNLHYRAESPAGHVVNLVQIQDSNEYLITVDDDQFPVRNALTGFNVKEFDGIYPVDFALLPDDRLMVRFAFIRTAEDPSSSLVETDHLNLPLPHYHILLHKGTASPANECQAIITFDWNTRAATSFVQLPSPVEYQISGSSFGGFYLHAGGSVIADPDNTLKKYDRNGMFDWEYRPRTGETFYSMDETENFIYLCGSTINTEEYGVEVPFVVQLTKRGEKNNEMTIAASNARFTGIICRDHLLYAKTEFLGERLFGSDYYPHFLLESVGDNFGVRHKCVWEQWGEGLLGGCGIVSEEGKWLKRPVLQWESIPEDPYYDWEFGGFGEDHLVFRHHGKYGLMDKEGRIVIEPKYDLLELLENPMYARVTLDRQSGVIDVNGKVVVPLEYDYVGRMSEDVIIVARDGLYGCFDKNGNLTAPIEFPEIREFVGGLARARDARDRKHNFGFIDAKGNWIIPAFFEEVEDIYDACAIATGNNKIGMAIFRNDGEGEWTWDWVAFPMYDAGGSMSEGLAYMGSQEKFGYINKSGDFVIPQRYSHATDFRRGMASVAMDGRWGVIDKEGNVIVPFEFDKTEIASDRFILVENEGKYGIFRPDGTVLFPAECDSVELYEDGSMFRYGVAGAMYKGERVRIDELGHVVWKYPITR